MGAANPKIKQTASPNTAQSRAREEEVRKLIVAAERCVRCGVKFPPPSQDDEEDVEYIRRPNDRHQLLWGVCQECVKDGDIENVHAWTASMGSQLLTNVRDFLYEHVTLQSDAEYDMLAVWALHTYVFHRKYHTPYLLALSPMKGSGKSTLLNALLLIVRNGHKEIDPAAAATAEFIDAETPTWLVDEIDGVWTAGGKDKQQLRSIINQGYERNGSWRRKRKGGVQTFKVFCPKVLAGIEDYSIPIALRDRCIEITLHKQTKAESEQRHRLNKASEVEANWLQCWAIWWAKAHEFQVELCEPKPPEHLANRDWDKWLILFAIADIIGGQWPKQVLDASIELLPEEDEDPKMALLRDTKRLFDEEREPWLESQMICSKLNAVEDSIWADWKGRGLTPHALARLTRSIDRKLVPDKRRHHGNKQSRGYARSAFEPMWERWLS